MGRIEKLIEIKASPEKVWEMLAFDRHAEWDEAMKKGLKSLEYTSEVHAPEDKYKAGASAQVKMGEGEFDFIITESLENEKMAFQVKKIGTSQILATMTFSLEPMEGGTEMRIVYDYEMPWGVFGKFLEKLFARRMEEKHQEKCLDQLKIILEK